MWWWVAVGVCLARAREVVAAGMLALLLQLLLDCVGWCPQLYRYLRLLLL